MLTRLTVFALLLFGLGIPTVAVAAAAPDASALLEMEANGPIIRCQNTNPNGPNFFQVRVTAGATYVRICNGFNGAWLNGEHFVGALIQPRLGGVVQAVQGNVNFNNGKTAWIRVAGAPMNVTNVIISPNC